MAARRLLILMVLLLVVSTLAAALVPPPQSQREGSETETTTTEPRPERKQPQRRGRLIERTVDVSPRGPETIRMRRGDELTLTVRSDVPDQVEIPAFGRIEDVGPGDPARFDLLPAVTGIFDARLLDARRVVARLRVSPARPSKASRQPRERERRG